MSKLGRLIERVLLKYIINMTRNQITWLEVARECKTIGQLLSLPYPMPLQRGEYIREDGTYMG